MGILSQSTEQAIEAIAQAGAQGAKALTEQAPIGKVIAASQAHQVFKAGSSDDVDVSAFVLPEGAGGAGGAGGTGAGGESTPQLKTGIAGLDQKIANRNLSMFDYYLAKNYLGIDLSAYSNASLELNQKIANRDFWDMDEKDISIWHTPLHLHGHFAPTKFNTWVLCALEKKMRRRERAIYPQRFFFDNPHDRC